MEDNQFDGLARAVGSTTTRRTAIGGLTAAVLGVFGIREAAAKKTKAASKKTGKQQCTGCAEAGTGKCYSGRTEEHCGSGGGTCDVCDTDEVCAASADGTFSCQPNRRCGFPFETTENFDNLTCQFNGQCVPAFENPSVCGLREVTTGSFPPGSCFCVKPGNCPNCVIGIPSNITSESDREAFCEDQGPNYQVDCNLDLSVRQGSEDQVGAVCGLPCGTGQVCDLTQTNADDFVGVCTANPTCGADSCAGGCCNYSFVNPGEPYQVTCVPAGGPAQNAFVCGTGGVTCVDCTAAGGPNASCQAGVCTGGNIPPGPEPCNPTNCPGCCAAGVCQTGDSDEQCGVRGATCIACIGKRKHCQPGGICQGKRRRRRHKRNKH